MASAQDYTSSMDYEIFIKRAHKLVGQTTKKGASLSFMSNLIDAENGNSNVKHLRSAQKLLTEVKGYISDAIDAFLKPARKLNSQEKQELETLKNELNFAYSSTQLLRIINEALTITRPYKD